MEVVSTDDLSGGSRDNVAAGATWVQGDLRDAEFVRSLWEGGPFAVVYHLGAYAAEGLSHFIRSYNYRTNLDASINLINESLRNDVRRFVFTSSIAVYGSGQVPMAEAVTPVPEDPYGIAKYAVELDLAAAHRVFGLDYTVFRPHNVYGERQNIADPYRNVVAIFMNSIVRGEAMPIFGDGLQTRAFSYIADVAGVIARSPMVPAAANEVFNVGSDDPRSVLELAHLVADAFEVTARIEHLPARHEALHAFAEHSKLKKVMDLGRSTQLETGIRRMASWVREHGAREPSGFSDPIEVTRNLPPSWEALTQRRA
jgi:UDP-glucose 4-epimerase